MAEIINLLQKKGADNRALIARFVELLVINQGKTVINTGEHIFNQPRPDPHNPMGRVGLTIEEALEFNFINGIINGFIEAQPALERQDNLNVFKAEIHRQLTELRNSPPATKVEIYPAEALRSIDRLK